VLACTAVAPTVAYRFTLVPPLGQSPTSATLLVGYDSGVLSIPGTGSSAQVNARIVAPAPLPNPFIRNDANYAVSVVIGRPTPLSELFTITFDRCQGAPAPVPGDVACSVLGCSAGGGPIEGCECEVSLL
jgi:hypothetical protein